jgi:hypothetical protein
MTDLGVGPGWRCLDVGDGDGSVARWLAGRVGPEGHVTTTDLNTRFLVGHGLPNLEVRRHNILEDSLTYFGPPHLSTNRTSANPRRADRPLYATRFAQSTPVRHTAFRV